TTAISLFCADALAGPVFDLAIRVQNGGSALVPNARLCGLRPLTLNGKAYDWQVVHGLSAALPGSPYCLSVDEVGPYQARHLGLQWVPLGEAKAESSSLAVPYELGKEPSAELLDLARSFERHPADARIKPIYDWMLSNIAFSGIRRGIDGAEHALKARQGDCTEHMLLAAELLQRNGVTVRRALGVLLDKDQARISAATLHNWIEYLDNGQWLVFDSSRKVLGAVEDQHYIALLFYESSRQLSVEPLVIDSPRLKLYLH
ncbi:MAG TPA: transglutaminase-like domain-containing protein, partial [Pseudomonas sp.]|nr:transglutaminase-like domain-containing protein [Pseudomonas sp.]